MRSFKSYLIEAAGSEEKLKHLEHAEDHHINAGEDGFLHAFRTLDETDKLMSGEKSKASVSTKLDGSPSVVFGTNPENGKFFVSSKSAFNKDPKLNYTEEDIERNHGHAPGLVAKLKAAMQHLPKVTPKEGVFQGDFMYSKDDGDVKETDGSYNFKPNTINYSTSKDSEEGQKVKNAQIGVAVHTHYHGDNLENMKAQFNKGSEGFGEHPDVHMVKTEFDSAGVSYKPEDREQFRSHMAKAMQEHSEMPNYDHHEGHDETMKTYINSTVRDGTTPNADGYRGFMENRLRKEVDKVSSPKAKEAKQEKMYQNLFHIDKNKEHFDRSFRIHKHLQDAKNVLVNSLSSSRQNYHHTVDGNEVKPEGFVTAIDNRPTKLTDRHEFNRLNFAARPR
jgi:hypothetical protein